MSKVLIILLSVALTLSLTVHGQSTTVTLNIDSSTEGDAMVGSAGLVNTNYGSQDFMNVYYSDQTTPIVYRSFLKFDLSSIPVNAVITDATLELVPKSVDNTTNNSYYVSRVDGAWEASQITWTNQPGTLSSDQVTVDNAAASSTSTHSINVRDHVQTMVKFPTTNHGWDIRLQNETVSGADYGISFWSSESTNTANRPKLTVTYVMPMDLTGVATHCTAGNTDGSIDFTYTGGSGLSPRLFTLYKVNEDPAASLGVTLVAVHALNQNTVAVDNETIDVTGLEPGLYMAKIIDEIVYSSPGYNMAEYLSLLAEESFLIGREGEVTNVTFTKYVETMNISQYVGGGNYYYSDNNYYGTTPGTRIRTGGYGTDTTLWNYDHDSPNNMRTESLFNTKINFPSDLEFLSSDLYMKHHFTYQHSSGSNAIYFTPVTEPWRKTNVTWNTRPGTDESAQLYLPKTSNANGYTSGEDAIDISSLVEYWQHNPNYGFELKLADYNNPRATHRSYADFSKTTLGRIELSFEVKPIKSTYDASKGSGEITVSAPDGILPYTYLISTKPIPDLDELWSTIPDSIIIDSTSFFSGKENTREFTFKNLESERYYVAVFDNNGQKIYHNEKVVSPEIKLYHAANIVETTPGRFEMAPNANGNGKATIFGSLEHGKSGGIEFQITQLGQSIIGFNEITAQQVEKVSDMVFGVETKVDGTCNIYSNGLLVKTEIISESSRIRLVREQTEFVLYIDEEDVYKTGDRGDETIGYKIDFEIEEEYPSKIHVKAYLKSFLSVIYPITAHERSYCGDLSATIQIGYPCEHCIENYVYATYTDLSTSITTNIQGPMPLTIPLSQGSYLISYNLGTSSNVSLIGGSQIVNVGHIIDWDMTSSNGHLLLPGNQLQTLMFGNSTNFVGAGSTFATNILNTDADEWLSFKTCFDYPPVKDNQESGLSSYASIELIDQSNNTVTKVLVLRDFFGNLTASVSDGTTYSTPVTADIDDTYTIENIFSNGSNTIKVFKEGIQIGNDIPVSNNLQLRVKGETGSYACIRETYVSFCRVVPDQFIQLERKIQGGYYQVPNDNILRVEYNEEYNDADGQLNYQIKKLTGEPVISNTSVTESVTFGDNRIYFNVASLNYNEFYILEVTNDKRETFYLRFKL